MRLRVVFLTLPLALALPMSGLCADFDQAQSSQSKQTSSPVVLKSAEQRDIQHSGLEWASVSAHLPDPQTASAEKLKIAADNLAARRYFEDALDYYGYALARGGDPSELQNQIGVVWLKLGQRIQARAAFLRAVHVQKRNSHAWNNLGVMEYENKNYQQAISDYSRAVHIDRESAAYRSNLALGYFSMSDMESARKQFIAAMRLDPNFMTPDDGYGASVHILSGNNYSGICFQLARLYASQNQLPEMRLWLAKASEAGFDVKAGMETDAVLKTYMKDPEIRQILLSEDAMRKTKVTSAKVPPLRGVTN
jgi:tetratricopeptide (TPR) repeat protein